MHIAEKVSNAELEVMKILWHRDVPVSSTDIRNELAKKKKWGKSTVLTLLRRLVDKSVISAEKRDATFYTPNISEEEFKSYQTSEMVDRLYGGSVKNLVASLCQDNKLTEADVDELKAYFKVGDKK